jgi:hypothetical protein
MMLSKTGAAVLVLCLLYCFTAALSQQNSPTLPLSEFKDPEVQKRIDAYGQVRANKEALKRADVITALVDLLDLENRGIHKRWADTTGDNEGYSEYIGALLGTVADIADWHDRRQLCVLAESTYDPGSEFATRLAFQGGAAAAPCLLKMARSRISFDRFESIPVLVHLAAVTRDLSPSVRQQIRQVTLEGLRNGDTRLVTVQAVGEFVGGFETPDMIPILQDIARTDPYSRLLDNGKRRFDVREAAVKAIRSIQERAMVNKLGEK